MPLRARIRSLWRSLAHGDRLDDELDEELHGYLDELIIRKVRAGLDPAAARRQAQMEIGSVEALKDDVRDARVGHALELTMQDVRIAWRGLRRSPGLTAAAVVTFALGVGANTAIFSVVRAMLIAPLPYRDSSRLVFVWSDMSAAGYPRAPLSAPELKDLRDRTTLFAGFGGIWATTAALTGDGDPEQLRIALVTTNFFSVLGADAALGRTFAPDDESQASPRTILLSWALWQRRYGGDPTIVGRSIRVNGQPTTVVGVMAADFRLLLPPDSAVPDDLEAWQLLNPASLTRGPRGQQYLRVIGRMKSGVSVDQAHRDVDAVAKRISTQFTDYSAAPRVFTTVGLQADGVRQIRPVLLALFVGVGILLLIACVNVASLLIARAAARRREAAVRLSLGAGRARLLRQCLAEGLLLAALGAIAGLLLARGGLAVLLALRPTTLNRLGTASIDGVVLAFTMAVALGWGVLFSLAPLAEVLRADVATTLRGDGRRSAGGLQFRTRAAIVVLQVALTVVLVVAAVLMVRTSAAIQRVDPGFRSESTLSFRVSLPGSRYGSPEAFNEFGRRLQKELGALPGVTGVGAVSHLPYDSLPNWGGPYISTPGADETTAMFADHRAVSPGFFETVGAPLVEGRFFSDDDDQRRTPVVVVDDQLAQHAWPGQSAIGRRIAADPRSTGHPVFWATVVGVVRHIRHRSLLENLNDEVFFAERQIQRNPMAYIVRTSGNPGTLAGPVRRIVAAIDPQLPVYDIRPLQDYVTDARAAQHFTMLLSIVFAAVAMLLAGVGIYGLIAYTVTRRRYEFGIRLALGATSGHVIGLIVREGAALAVAGMACGTAGAALATRLLETQLFAVSPYDGPSFAAALVVILLAAMLASWVPARQAARISPSEALSGEGAV